MKSSLSKKTKFWVFAEKALKFKKSTKSYDFIYAYIFFACTLSTLIFECLL